MAFITIKKPGAPAQKTGLFGGANKPVMQPGADVSRDIMALSRRLKVMEERYTDLQVKTQSMEMNMLAMQKQISIEIKTTNSDIKEMRKEIFDLNANIFEFVSELKEAAKKEDVKILEKYVNLWEPINFVTHKEVEDIVKEAVERNTQTK